MSVVAVTPIQHGLGDGTVKQYNVGDTLDLDEDILRSLVENGSAVEMGSKRKFSSPFEGTVAGTDDADTRKRDELIAKSLTESVEKGEQPSPAAADAQTSSRVQEKFQEAQDARAEKASK